MFKDTKDSEESNLSASYAYGSLYYHSLNLRITHPGCEYRAATNIREKLRICCMTSLKILFISGYGDMESLETKVDCEVRNARARSQHQNSKSSQNSCRTSRSCGENIFFLIMYEQSRTKFTFTDLEVTFFKITSGHAGNGSCGYVLGRSR